MNAPQKRPRFKNSLLRLGLLGLFATVAVAPLSSKAYTDGALFRENFEMLSHGSPFFRTSEYDLRVRDYTTNGIDGKILQAIYKPTNRGSARITKHYSIRAVESATLSFDMKLHSQFEFVRGGKMHGLSGGSGTTGCDPITKEGWSVRMVWQKEGVPALYVYHQDREAECGDKYDAIEPFNFRRGTWYHIDIHVKMNTRGDTANGKATLYIDGQKIAETPGLRLNGDGKTLIDKFRFSTFYGGSTPDWAPSKTTYAYFDNFTVRPGHVVPGEESKLCEIWGEGMYNPRSKICCDEGCNGCGGSGCGNSAHGGASKCCTGHIQQNASSCDPWDVRSPCFFDF